jgi:hypothetical protein
MRLASSVSTFSSFADESAAVCNHDGSVFAIV